MKQELYARYIYIIVFIGIFTLSFFVVKPLLTPLVFAAVLAYVFYPVYNSLYKKTGRKNLSALIITILIILIVTIPIVLTLNIISKEVYVSYIKTRQQMATGTLFGIEDNKDGFLNKIYVQMNELIGSSQVRYYVENGLNSAVNKITNGVSDFIFAIPKRMLDLFVLFFATFFLFKDGDKLIKNSEALIPLKRKHRKKIYIQFKDLTYGVVYGNIITAMVQGFIAFIGFWIFDVPTPILWSIVTAFAALIPFIGTALVWLPLALFKIFDGYLSDNLIISVKGIGLILYGAFIIGSIDNIIKPKLIGDKARVHPLLVLIGVVGGIAAFGVIGLILGPMILALLTTFIKIQQDELT